MSRSLKKGPYVCEKLFKKAMKAQEAGIRQPIKAWSRSCTIVPEFIGMNFDVHNGKTFVKVYVTEEMVGHKLGEFAPTRAFRSHIGKR